MRPQARYGYNSHFIAEGRRKKEEGRRKKEEAVSCRAFKLHILGGRDPHPTKILLFFDIQFKSRTA
ncbi:hypothetical protein QUB56_27950 [Microcoleus sp. AR_TQ3_B6]|uniref:hypothetical protein n=1 Tax=Microcoleus sp. AR_TQ3_B6 TaxID=3055284 RepID=UPI002FD725DA